MGVEGAMKQALQLEEEERRGTESVKVDEERTRTRLDRTAQVEKKG